MVHQNLVEYRNLLKQCLVGVTNNHQAAKLKYRFKYEFTKGKGAITSTESGNKTQSYFKLEIYLEDYTNEKVETIVNEEGVEEKVLKGSIRTNLFRYAMPQVIKVSKAKMEEEAIKAFFLYCVNSGLMVQLQLNKERFKQTKPNSIDGNEYYEVTSLVDLLDEDR